MYRCVNGMGSVPEPTLTVANTAEEPSFFDIIGQTIKDALPVAGDLLKEKLKQKAEKKRGRGAQLTTGTTAPAVASTAPGFFQKVDPRTGLVATDWMKVGVVGGGVALAGVALFGAMRRRRRR